MNTTLPKQSSQELKRRGRPAGGQEIEINANYSQLYHISETIKGFLTRLRPQGLLNLVAIIPDEKPTGKTFEMPAEAKAATDWAADRNKEGMNVYFTVNPVKTRISGKPSKRDIAAAEYTHVDIDPSVTEGYEVGRRLLLENMVPELKGFEPSPALIVDSGNGLGAFWRIDGGSIEQVEQINLQLIQRFGGDAGTHNIDRLMRLPGTRNYPTKKKLAKGYLSEPGEAKLLDTSNVQCAAEELAAKLPQVPHESKLTKSAAAKPTQFSEDTRPLSQEEIVALDARLKEALERSPNLKRRWHGEPHGLTDTSRSGFDFSVTALLKAAGFSYRETVHLLVHSFKHGKGTDNTERDLQRSWERCGISSPDEIVSLCKEANGRGEAWEPVLYAARPNAQTVDHVLTQLGNSREFAGKRALKMDYEAYAASKAGEESEQQVQEQAGQRLALLWDPTRMNEMVKQTENALQASP